MNKKKILINLCCTLNIYEDKIIKNQYKNSPEKNEKDFNSLLNKNIKKGDLIQYIFTEIQNYMLVAKKI